MIIGPPFAMKKFNKIAREGGDTGIVCEQGYAARRMTYGRGRENFTYMGFPMYSFVKVTDTGEKAVGLWAAAVRCTHEWYVLTDATRQGLKDLIREWRRLNPDS